MDNAIKNIWIRRLLILIAIFLSLSLLLLLETWFLNHYVYTSSILFYDWKKVASGIFISSLLGSIAVTKLWFS